MEIFVYLRAWVATRTSSSSTACGRGTTWHLPMLTRALTSFDALRAKTRLDKDRQKLVAVIESTFGDFEHFNTVVRGVFEARQRPSLAKLSTAGSLGASRSQLSVPESSSERPSVVSPHAPHTRPTHRRSPRPLACCCGCRAAPRDCIRPAKVDAG